MLSSDITVYNAHLIGLWLQIFATGAYCVYLIQCISVLRRKWRNGGPLWLYIACGLMFATTITALATDIYFAFEAYGVHGDEPPNPFAVYMKTRSPVSLVKNSIIATMSIISDAVIVYRTLVIWNSTISVILIPMGLFLAGVALDVWSIWTLSRTADGDNTIDAAVILGVRYYFVVTLCLNLYCATFICWKIWRVTSRVPQSISGFYSHRPVTRVLEIVIESAALYCAYLIALLISNCIRSNVFVLLLDPLPPVTGLVFSMIIVRASSGNTYGTRSGPSLNTVHFWSTGTGTSDTHGVEEDNRGEPPAEIAIELGLPTRGEDRDDEGDTTSARFTSRTQHRKHT